MRLNKIIKIIKKFQKTPADRLWLKNGRQNLQNLILQNPVRKPTPIRLQLLRGSFNQFNLKPMPIAIIALIATLITGGGVAAKAQNSLPNDILYPVKLTTEAIQESLTFDQVKKIELQTQLAEKRLDEIQQLQKAGTATEQNIQPTLLKYENHIATAQASLNQLNNNYQPPKVIAAALKLENAIEKQQATLEKIAVESPTLAQVNIGQAKKVAVSTSGQTLAKIENKIAEIKKTYNPTGDQIETEVLIIKPSPIKPTEGENQNQPSEGQNQPKIEVEVDINNLDQRAENRLNTAENKLREIRNKLDIFSGQKEKKCSEVEKNDYRQTLEKDYQKITESLDWAKKYYQQKEYLASLKQSNLITGWAIDLDNLIGQFRRRCDGQSNSRVVPLDQKFELKISETVTIKNENILLTLDKINLICPTCSPCNTGETCPTCGPCNPNATFRIGHRTTVTCPTNAPCAQTAAAREFYLAVNQKEPIGNDIYLQLLNIAEDKVTVILTKETPKPPVNDSQVYLDQEFNLNVGQTAQVVNYQGLKIKFESVTSTNIQCIKAPCPNLSAKFTVGFPYTCSKNPAETNPNSANKTLTTCQNSATQEINLVTDQSTSVFGVNIKLLSLLKPGGATLIVSQQNIVCPSPNCVDAYSNGEYDKNGCLIYQCPKKTCQAVFSSCTCSYQCREVYSNKTYMDCTRVCTQEDTNNYQPSCGYINGNCQDLNKECVKEGRYTTGPVSPEYATECCEGLKGYNTRPTSTGGGLLCYNPTKGLPTCINTSTEKEGWYYQSGELLLIESCANSQPPCPLYALPPDYWCKEGKIIPGTFDQTTGCQGPPTCEVKEPSITGNNVQSAPTAQSQSLIQKIFSPITNLFK